MTDRQTDVHRVTAYTALMQYATRGKHWLDVSVSTALLQKKFATQQHNNALINKKLRYHRSRIKVGLTVLL